MSPDADHVHYFGKGATIDEALADAGLIELGPKATIAANLQRITIRMEGHPPNSNEQNRLVQQARWRERRTWREAAAGDAAFARHEWERYERRKWQPLLTADLRITFILPDRKRRDFDNLVSTVKARLDGLVDAGIIVDDSIFVLRSVSTAYRVQKGVKATTFDVMGYPT